MENKEEEASSSGSEDVEEVGEPILCAVCRNPALYVCTGCRQTYYCSPKCQDVGWIEKGHDKSCQLLKQDVGMPYSNAQRRLIYARGGHITPAGHARSAGGKKFHWPSQ